MTAYVVVWTVSFIAAILWAIVTDPHRSWIRFYKTLLPFGTVHTLVLIGGLVAEGPDVWSIVAVAVQLLFLAYVTRALRKEQEKVAWREIQRRLEP